MPYSLDPSTHRTITIMLPLAITLSAILLLSIADFDPTNPWLIVTRTLAWIAFTFAALILVLAAL